MKLICAACGNEMVVEGELQGGEHVKCPFCGEVTACSRPSRIEVPVGATREPARPKDESLDAETPKRKLRVIRNAPPLPKRPASPMGVPPPVAGVPPLPPRPTNKRKGGGQGGGGIGGLIVLLLVLGAAFWGVRTFIFTSEDAEEADIAVPAKVESQTADEEAARRQKAREEEERRQAERQREREKKEKERAEARAELARKAEAERAAREAYRTAQDTFAGKPSHFAVSASKDKVGDPRKMTESASFWAVDKTFAENGAIYEIQTGTQGVASVGLRTTNGQLCEVNVDEFVSRLDEGVWAVSDGEVVWLFGTGKQMRTMPVPDDGKDVYPMGDELGDLDVTLETLRTKLPDVRYRLSLQSRNGGKDIPLGIIQGHERFSLRNAREAVKELIVERRAAKFLASLKKPKPKKFRQTVVFYDGDVLKKGVDGVTRVPRTFKYLGTSRYDNDYGHVSDVRERAREKWERMRAEAERQERKAIEVKAENHAAIEAYKRRRENACRDVVVSDEEIDDELKKYVLLIERSRTKVADPD